MLKLSKIKPLSLIDIDNTIISNKARIQDHKVYYVLKQCRIRCVRKATTDIIKTILALHLTGVPITTRNVFMYRFYAKKPKKHQIKKQSTYKLEH